jgi:methanogenic corrinoid protein MtbC1
LNKKKLHDTKGNSESTTTTVSEAILAGYDKLAQEITDRKQKAFQELIAQHNIEWSKLLEYTHYDLSSLINALTSSSPQVFIDYMGWAATLFKSNNIPFDLLKKNIEIIDEVLTSFLPGPQQAVLSAYLKEAVSEIDKYSTLQKTHIDPSSPHGKLAEKYLAALVSANREKAVQLILDSYSNGVSIKDIYLQVLQPVQYEIGVLWQLNKISVAHEHYASSVTQLVMSQLYTSICLQGNTKPKGMIVAVCASGELHEIGIRMVSDFFEMEGWKTHLLGANMPVNALVQTLLAQQPDLLAISASMSSNVVKTRKLIKAVRTSQAQDIKIIVGGYLFNRVPDLWKQVAADYYAKDAEEALRIVNQISQQKK